jgi:hypothetical protein
VTFKKVLAKLAQSSKRWGYQSKHMTTFCHIYKKIMPRVEPSKVGGGLENLFA